MGRGGMIPNQKKVLWLDRGDPAFFLVQHLCQRGINDELTFLLPPQLSLAVDAIIVLVVSLLATIQNDKYYRT